MNNPTSVRARADLAKTNPANDVTQGTLDVGAPEVDAEEPLPTATPHDTLLRLARDAARGYTVLRDHFVQVPAGRGWTGSSLGRLVTARQPRALTAYLLVLMINELLERRASPLDADVWRRALSPAHDHLWPEKALTPVWVALAAGPDPLITKVRQGRLIKITPRREDGGAEYKKPRPDVLTRDRGELFFALPDAFWLEGWHYRLSLPGIAVLLILLQGTQRREEMWLSPERATDWYGIAPKTMYAGLEELRREGLVKSRSEWVKAELSRIGRTKRVWYRLEGPFSTEERRRLQQKARAETKTRASRSQPPAERSDETVPSPSTSPVVPARALIGEGSETHVVILGPTPS